MSEEVLKIYHADTTETFRNYKNLAGRAIEQISDEEFFRRIDSEANSIAAVSKHVGGNLRSRWTDFLISDGEKPDRNRDAEFVAETDTREGVIEIWNDGWNELFNALESLKIEDFGKIVTIRGENYTVIKAINRALAHTASHVGQIILLAKHFRAEEWKTLSVPKNKSGEFNVYLAENKDKTHYLNAAREFAEKNEK